MSHVAAALLDPRAYPFHHEVTTRFADMDPLRHINNVAMAATFEDVRARFAMTHSADFLKPPHRTMIVANNISYLAEAHYPAPLVVYVGCLEVGRTSWKLASIALQGDRVCAYCECVLVSTRDGRPFPVSDDHRRNMQSAMLQLRGAAALSDNS